MKTIWKYKVDAVSEIQIPAGSKVVNVSGQHGEVCIWAEVSQSASNVELRKFRVIGTGQTIQSDAEYVGTAMLHNGDYVFHVYEITGAKPCQE